MTRSSELGRTARLRRRELGVSQSQVADAIGVSPLQVGRWERGVDVPSPLQVSALADVLDLGQDAAEAWVATAEAQTLSIEIVDEPSPPLTVVETELMADPWTPPEKQIAPPRLDRAALLGKRSARRRGRRGGNGRRSATTVVPIGGDVPDALLERTLERRARDDEGRLHRKTVALQRPEREGAAAEARFRPAERAGAAATAPLRIPPPAHREAPAPAGAANTGAVFPVPDTKRGSERVTYQAVGEASAVRDRFTYPMRLAGTIVALILLAGLLWWAVGSLGDGLGAVMDLLRGGEEPLPDPEAVRLVLPG